MLIEERQEGNTLVVKVQESRLDAHVAVGFKDKMFQLIDQGSTDLVLDLSSVDFIDSSGLGSIVSSLKRLGGQGSLVVCGLHGAIQSMFKLTRMDRVFSIYATAEEALEQRKSA